MHKEFQKMQGSIEKDMQPTCFYSLAMIIHWQKG